MEHAALLELLRQARRERTERHCLPRPETVSDLSEQATRILSEYVVSAENGFANRCFILKQQKGEAIAGEPTRVLRSALESLVDLFEKHGLPFEKFDAYHFATLAAFFHTQAKDSVAPLSRWRRWLPDERRRYIPASDIRCSDRLASYCLPAHFRDSDAEQLTVAEMSGQGIVSAPVVCELCHEGFAGRDCLARHCRGEHGNGTEYRKRLLHMAEKAGQRPLLPWVKRNMIQSYRFFSCYSVPSSQNDWTSKTMATYRPRGERACAVCAVKDWIENRFQIFLFAEPDGEIPYGQFWYGANAQDSTDETSEGNMLLTHKGHLCVGPKEAVHNFLDVHLYARAFSKIPLEELYASSIQHPHDTSMHWLLHTRRIPVLSSTNSAAEPRATSCGPCLPASAGVGDTTRTVWTCWDCASKLCRRRPRFPRKALANRMWIGRQHPLFRDLTLAMRLWCGLGRPILTQLFLGRGAREEVHQGFTGNTMLIAQPTAQASQVVPSVQGVLSSLVIFSVDPPTMSAARGPLS